MLDTELLGHWWYVAEPWLGAVVEECARQGLELVGLDDALRRVEAVPAGEWPGAQASSWGAHGDLSTWSGPAVADVAFELRAAELQVIAAGALGDRTTVRELLALQSSDWAFMLGRGLAGPYARERVAGHGADLRRALDEPGSAGAELRNLAHFVTT